MLLLVHSHLDLPKYPGTFGNIINNNYIIFILTVCIVYSLNVNPITLSYCK